MELQRLGNNIKPEKWSIRNSSGNLSIKLKMAEQEFLSYNPLLYWGWGQTTTKNIQKISQGLLERSTAATCWHFKVLGALVWVVTVWWSYC